MNARRLRLPAVALVPLVGAGLVWSALARDDDADQGWAPQPSDELRVGEDALHRRELAELAVFTDWLARHDAEGYIGEMGIPGGDERWTTFAQRWFEAAAEAGLWVDVWSVGEWWRQNYTYCPFVSPPEEGAVSITRPSGRVLMWAARNTDLPRGVNLSGGEFGAAGGSEQVTDFSNEAPGSYGEAYHYDSQETMDYLGSRGIDTIRLPFRWERVQPRLGAPLDPAEVGRLQDAVARAHAAGLEVILDVHNFAAYHLAENGRGVRRPIGSAEVSVADFADLWRRLSGAFDGVAGVAAYDLMNEPVDLPSVDGRAPAQVWEQASQAAVDAVRGRGDDTLIMVPGYQWSHAGEWAEQHPRAWIEDPADNVRYAAHHYWSDDRGVSYDADLAEAIDDGY